MSVTPFSVYLTWTAPAPVNGIVSYYTVLINGTRSYEYWYQYELYTGSNATAYNVTYLEACETYSFAVSATIAGCMGPYSAALMNITTTTNSE